MHAAEIDKENINTLIENTYFVLHWITQDAPNAELTPDKSKELVPVSNTDLMAFYTSFVWFLREGDEHMQERKHLGAIYKVISGIREARKFFSPHSGLSFMRRDALWVLLTGFIVCLLAEVKRKTLSLKKFEESLTEEVLRGVIGIMPEVWIENVLAIKATAKAKGVLRVSYLVPKTPHTIN